MSRVVQITFDTEQQKEEFAEYAAARGLSLSAFVKYACFVAKDKYRLGAHHPVKKAGRINAPLAKIDENPETVSKTGDVSSSIARARNPKIKTNSKNKTKTLSTVAPSALHLRIRDGFLKQNGGRFDDFPREGKAIKWLIEKAQKRDPEHFEDLLLTVCAQFWKLKQTGNAFWQGQPFLPSTLNSSGIWTRVLETLRRPEIDPEVAALIGAQT